MKWRLDFWRKERNPLAIVSADGGLKQMSYMVAFAGAVQAAKIAERKQRGDNETVIFLRPRDGLAILEEHAGIKTERDVALVREDKLVEWLGAQLQYYETEGDCSPVTNAKIAMLRDTCRILDELMGEAQNQKGDEENNE